MLAGGGAESLDSQMASSPPELLPSENKLLSSMMDGALCGAVGQEMARHENPTSPDKNTTEDLAFSHSLEPGDHVIRWEMLPIVYPIQIHGIVLEAREDYVTIVDFGLTSYQEEVVQAEEEEEETLTDAKTGGMTSDKQANNEINTPDDSTVSPKQASLKREIQQQRLSSSDHLMRLSVMENKSRLNVTTIRNAKEIRAWKKVNYGENMFSKSLKKSNSWWRMGSMKVNNACMETPDGQEEEQNEKQDKPTDTVTKYKLSLDADPEKSSADDKDGTLNSQDVPSPTAETIAEVKRLSNALPQTQDSLEKPKPLDKEIGGANKAESESQSPATPQNNPRRSWWQPKVSSNNMSTKETDEEEGTSTKPQWWKSWTSKNEYQSLPFDNIPSDQVEKEIAWANAGRPQLSQRHMNPAMSSLMKKSAKGQELSPKQKLPKADPPKLVLARTNFLLQHGESVLPPYHVFASNSECIAVWCMTGRWSTLQASVFLHSTAIGHAKTATAITLGVAATQPWLVPALAVVGGAAVGMPWIILKRSKDRWEEATMKLNDLFWAQAEPEVFVECIVKWSKLGGDTVEQKEEATTAVVERI